MGMCFVCVRTPKSQFLQQEPTDKFALALTRNAFPGAPIRVGRKRIEEPKIQAVVVNNKVRPLTRRSRR